MLNQVITQEAGKSQNAHNQPHKNWNE